MIFSRDKYKTYAQVYDACKGDRSENIQLIRDLIQKYRPASKDLLELACGTGVIMRGLASAYNVVGLDNSPAMLAVARKKAPQLHFVQANMINFAMPLSFDVLYCLHNSVNHLVQFKDWQKLFKDAAAHLRPGGLFIFDVNPLEKMETLTKLEPGIWPGGDDYMTAQLAKHPKEPGRYRWQTIVFLKRPNGKFLSRTRTVEVATFSATQIEHALTADFAILDSFVPKRPQMMDDIGRVYYVCAKK